MDRKGNIVKVKPTPEAIVFGLIIFKILSLVFFFFGSSEVRF